MNIKIGVASHKPYAMPSDGAYLPLQVGAAGKPSIRATGVLGVAGACAPEADFARDDEGENISSRNAGYCELTGLYWAWRNLKADAVGLSHYRRHFRGAHGVATGDEFAALLENFEVVLPRPRNYFIETTYSQYAHAHHAKDLDATRSVIEERCPEYLDSFDIKRKIDGNGSAVSYGYGLCLDNIRVFYGKVTGNFHGLFLTVKEDEFLFARIICTARKG